MELEVTLKLNPMACAVTACCLVVTLHAMAKSSDVDDQGSGSTMVSPAWVGVIGSLQDPVSALYTRFIGLDNFWSQRNNVTDRPCYPVSFLTQIADSTGICMNWIGGPAHFDHAKDALFAYGKGEVAAGSLAIEVANNNSAVRFEPGMSIYIQGSGVFLGILSSATLAGDRWTLRFDGGTRARLQEGASVYTAFTEVETTARSDANAGDRTVLIGNRILGVEPGMLVFDRDAQSIKGAFFASSHRGAMLGVVQSYKAGFLSLTGSLAFDVKSGDRLGITLRDKLAAGGGGAVYVGIANQTPYSQIVGYGTRVDCEGLSLGCAAFGQDITVQIEHGAVGSNLFGAEWDFNNHSGRPVPGSFGLWLQSTSEYPIGAGMLFDQYRSGEPTAYFKGIMFHKGVQQVDLYSEDNAGVYAEDVGVRKGTLASPTPGGAGIFLNGRYQSAALAISLPRSVRDSRQSEVSNASVTWVDPESCADGPVCRTYHTYRPVFQIGPKDSGRFSIGPVRTPVTIGADGALTSKSTISPGSFPVASLPLPCLPGQFAYASNGRKPGELQHSGSGLPVICTLDHIGGAAVWRDLFGGGPVKQ